MAEPVQVAVIGVAHFDEGQDELTGAPEFRIRIKGSVTGGDNAIVMGYKPPGWDAWKANEGKTLMFVGAMMEVPAE